MKRAVVSTVAFVAALTMTGCAADPPLDVAQNVDLSRFQGKWYEIAKLPRTTQADCNGTTAFYTLASDGSLQLVNQCNIGGATGPLYTVTMTASAPDKTVPAKLALQVSGFSGDYWILEVGSNYEYAVVGHPSRQYLWILSRAPTLDTTTTQGILSRAQTNQFDTSRIEYTPQPPSGERVSSDTPVGAIPPAMSTGCSISRGTGGDEESASWLGLMVACAALRAGRSRRSDNLRFSEIGIRIPEQTAILVAES